MRASDGRKWLMVQKVTSKDGTPIAYERTGQGKPVILVGGAMSDRMAAVPLSALLAPHFSVIAYDRRGRGDSGDAPTYAVEREIEDIDALIQAAGGSAFAVGYSSGAALALEAAAHGSALTKLAMYEAPFIVDDKHPPLPADYVQHLQSLVAAGKRGDAVEYFMSAAVGVPKEIIAQMRQSPMWPGLEKVAHTIAYDGMVMGDRMSGKPLDGQRWKKATMPILVMDGGASEEWMHNATRNLASVLPGAQHRTLPGQTHAAAPEVIAPVLIEFFGE
jgi:pimeloyl-ACP methyl ester carboxylesterase